MEQQQRAERLHREWATLSELRQHSSVFDFAATGDPPDRYLLTFRGLGLACDLAPRSDVRVVERHEIEVRLPFSYPHLPPDVRWVTPIFHPNVSFSGFIPLHDIGLPWADSLTLDVVCERLWDVARMAYMNLERATNFSAKNWVEKPHSLTLPVDGRILRDKMPPAGANVIRYQRRGREPCRPLPAGEEVLFIGEDTPVPPLPPPSYRPRPPARDNDDDILYIGDE